MFKETLNFELTSLLFFAQLHFEVPLSPVIAAKKARPSDGGSEEVCDTMSIHQSTRSDWQTCNLTLDFILQQKIQDMFVMISLFIISTCVLCPCRTWTTCWGLITTDR